MGWAGWGSRRMAELKWLEWGAAVARCKFAVGSRLRCFRVELRRGERKSSVESKGGVGES